MHRGYVTEETGSKDVGLRVSCMTDSLGHTAAPMMRFLLNYFILFSGLGSLKRQRVDVKGKVNGIGICDAKFPKNQQIA